MKLYRMVFVLLTVLVDVLWASSFPVRLLSERHRTEWNWVEYCLSLTNLSNSPLVNPTIRYFAENPRIQYCRANPNDTKCEGFQFNVFDVDSTLKAVVDYHSVDTSFYYGSDYTGNSLANQCVLVKTKFLKIILDSDNDQSQGYGYSISKIEHVPYGVLQVLFPPYKKGD